MKVEALEHIQCIIEHGTKIIEFTKNLALKSYEQDHKTRLAVERSFEIIGEALKRLARDEPELIKTISEYRQIISFRNILAHGYDSIEHKIVWGVIQGSLPKLLQDVQKCLMNDKA